MINPLRNSAIRKLEKLGLKDLADKVGELVDKFKPMKKIQKIQTQFSLTVHDVAQKVNNLIDAVNTLAEPVKQNRLTDMTLEDALKTPGVIVLPQPTPQSRRKGVSGEIVGIPVEKSFNAITGEEIKSERHWCSPDCPCQIPTPQSSQEWTKEFYKEFVFDPPPEPGPNGGTLLRPFRWREDATIAKMEKFITNLLAQKDQEIDKLITVNRQDAQNEILKTLRGRLMGLKKIPTEDQEEGLDFDNGYDQALSDVHETIQDLIK